MNDAQPPAGPASVGRTIFRNALIITLGSVTLKALNFLFSVYVVRRLGDDSFGQYSIVQAWVGLFSIFAELGVSQYVMRAIAQDRRRAATLFWNLVALRLLLAGVGIVGITLGARAAGYSAPLVLGVFLYTWTFVLSAFMAPLETLLTAHERFGDVTAMTIVGQVAFMVLGGGVLLAGWGFTVLIGVGLAAMLPPLAYGGWAARRHGLLSFRPQITPRVWPTLLRHGLPFGLISLALVIAFSIDTVMLSWTVPENYVAWYRVAYNLIFSVVGLLSSFSIAMVPSLARAYVDDVAQVERWYYRSFKFILLISLPAAVGGMLVAFPLIRLLYAPSTLPAAVALQVLVWDVPLLMYASFCGNMTTVVSEEKAAARIYGLNAVANLLLNAYAIPRFGVVGAALVTVVTDLIGALQFFFLLRRKLRLPAVGGLMARIALASALMGGVLVLSGAQTLWVLLPLGGLVYAGLVWVLRLLEPGEWDAIRRLLRRRPAGPDPRPAGRG